jgi:hypothetical protein
MLLADAMGRGLDGVRGFERFDLLGELGSARPFLVVCLMSRGGKPGLELVTQSGEFGEISIVQERLPRRAW